MHGRRVDAYEDFGRARHGRLLELRGGALVAAAEGLRAPTGLAVAHGNASLLVVCGDEILRYDLATGRADVFFMFDVARSVESRREEPTRPKIGRREVRSRAGPARLTGRVARRRRARSTPSRRGSRASARVSGRGLCGNQIFNSTSMCA